MNFLEDLLVYPKEWSVLCTVRRETLIHVCVLLLKLAEIYFKDVLREIFTCLESVRSPLSVTNLGFSFRVLFCTFSRFPQRFTL